MEGRQSWLNTEHPRNAPTDPWNHWSIALSEIYLGGVLVVVAKAESEIQHPAAKADRAVPQGLGDDPRLLSLDASGLKVYGEESNVSPGKTFFSALVRPSMSAVHDVKRHVLVLDLAVGTLEELLSTSIFKYMYAGALLEEAQVESVMRQARVTRWGAVKVTKFKVSTVEMPASRFMMSKVGGSWDSRVMCAADVLRRAMLFISDAISIIGSMADLYQLVDAFGVWARRDARIVAEGRPPDDQVPALLRSRVIGYMYTPDVREHRISAWLPLRVWTFVSKKNRYGGRLQAASCTGQHFMGPGQHEPGVHPEVLSSPLWPVSSSSSSPRCLEMPQSVCARGMMDMTEALREGIITLMILQIPTDRRRPTALVSRSWSAVLPGAHPDDTLSIECISISRDAIHTCSTIEMKPEKD